ncbi:hypothetical protein GYMLUDRAFT_714713 [Collybiopsis luxurians FD-317 M1]|nr:hypothetical protein GYMLUDRAFT_714713 [Collybiopsis luxurians FD-317 M1]
MSSSSLVVDTSGLSTSRRLRINSKPPQLDLDLSISPLQILPKYTLPDLQRHSQDVAPSDVASLSSFETSSSSTPSSPRLDGLSPHFAITIQSLGDIEEDEDSPAKSPKGKRPLPPVPLSAPLSPSTVHSPKTRPLPPTPHVKANSLSISVTPATPLAPATPIVESPHHLSAPRVRRLPKPLEIPSVQAPPSYQMSHRDSLVHSPDLISLPELPTPAAARQRRLSKLKRFLGETVPDELVPIISSARDPQTAKELLAHLRDFSESESVSNEIALDPVIISQRLKELEDDVTLSDAEDELVFLDEDEEAESPIQGSDLLLGSEHVFAAVPFKRYSRKWVWDKGGDRREEQDYAYILQALRSL